MRRLIREVSRKVAGTDRKPDAGEPADRDADILPLGGAALHPGLPIEVCGDLIEVPAHGFDLPR